ncbi:FtsX-like permease family protein [Acetatifactor muris]|uniref:Bacitracin export permease protein BceB n=1 Tax=Acetatifactor muris TaxID=879566 RepID=A0A2K4ZNG5_9FIRM|nr:FtsX-like permease family protein [Acetatifactor muris]MCR2050234.1 FtsX-like permease family protein [Acetatifactor muris]SOY31932.1 Bacitracin export permease protein BceB [Acetatifactor muris]
MKKYMLLLPRMAATNIRKNGSVYFPYMGAGIFAMFTYFVFDLILKNDVMRTLPKGVYALMLVQIGFGLLGLIMIPFLYYTNSFLIKRRKRELGLYSILGLEKKHIGIMMFWESLIIYAIVLVGAIGLGLVFSRLIFLLLLNLAKMSVDVKFSISFRAIADTVIFYAFIMGLNLSVNLVQVGRANPVELMGDSRKGEREPRWIGLWSIVGLAAMILGYRMAMEAKLDSGIFINFFLAVFLVILGTYFLFTSGSIAVLRFFKKRKGFYYRSENFITVSGMLYRMKKNAASLSNICVFSTMVIITVVCTVAVYLGMESIVTSNFNREFEVNFFGRGEVDRNALRQETAELAARHGVVLEEEMEYSFVEARAYQKEDAFQTEAPDEYAKRKQLYMMTVEEYNLLENAQKSLRPKEVMIFSSGADYANETVSFGDMEYAVKEELYESRIRQKHSNNTFEWTYCIVFADQAQLQEVSSLFGINSLEQMSYQYGFCPEGRKADIDAFSRELETQVSALPDFAEYVDRRQWMEEQESMYGGLLFIGIFFGAIFLICLLIIMYYKQITEGFEDQKNFEIMQQVGMGDGEIRRTIRKQISMVFGLPLLGAMCHTAVGMRMVYMLMGAIGFFETGLLMACSVGGCLVFALVYSLSYRRTSTAYYRIVRKMENNA